MIAIGLIVLAIILTTIIISRKHQIQPSYFSFFIIGITWLPLGLVLKNYFFAIMGTAFLVAGLANHNQDKMVRITRAGEKTENFYNDILNCIGVSRICVFPAG